MKLCNLVNDKGFPVSLKWAKNKVENEFFFFDWQPTSSIRSHIQDWTTDKLAY
jgi:hypothetical protein